MTGALRRSESVMEAGPYEEVARALAGGAFASIAYVEETQSTNADAASLLGDERHAGHTIVAEYQGRGAGRKGRTWLAPAGTGLLFTTILPRPVATETLWAVPYWVALVVRAALLDFGVRVTLQWPNDLLLANGKVAGVLCQSSVSGSTARVACGVGINVRRPGVDPGIVPPPAYCDDVALIERPALLREILERYERALFLLDDPQRVRIEWDRAAALPGPRYRVLLDGESEPFEAVALGLADGGGLQVRRGDGSTQVVSLADARVLRRTADSARYGARD
jgi:BirA family transcriptional regulator, biotin operon repressor / biotin---[acetyl-CoA-carboxylase] ligase